MSFIDEIKINVKAGTGGSGAATFRREKFIAFGGPDGGNGGNGGNIIFFTTRSKNTLLHMRYMQHIVACNGLSGAKRRKYGAYGEDKLVPLPIGTQVFDDNNKLIIDLDKKDMQFTIAHGGKGGAGNACFKNSKNQSPRNKVEGEKGEEQWIRLRLKMIADVGLIGMPNVGKSTFLSKCTNAKPKIADYPFTTLEPNLGMVQVHDIDFLIADMPGIVKGAVNGYGLGKKFLKHIERCNIFIHVIDSSIDCCFENYLAINKELYLYDENIINKKIIIAFTKIDLIDDTRLRYLIKLFEQYTEYPIFTLNYGEGKEKILELIYNFLKSKDNKKVYVYDPHK